MALDSPGKARQRQGKAVARTELFEFPANASRDPCPLANAYVAEVWTRSVLMIELLKPRVLLQTLSARLKVFKNLCGLGSLPAAAMA